MFFRRRGDGDDRWLVVKLWMFGFGAALAVLGMVFENNWLIWAAVFVLAAGILLRFVPRTPSGSRPPGDEPPA